MFLPYSPPIVVSSIVVSLALWSLRLCGLFGIVVSLAWWNSPLIIECVHAIYSLILRPISCLPELMQTAWNAALSFQAALMRPHSYSRPFNFQILDNVIFGINITRIRSVFFFFLTVFFPSALFQVSRWDTFCYLKSSTGFVCFWCLVSQPWKANNMLNKGERAGKDVAHQGAGKGSKKHLYNLRETRNFVNIFISLAVCVCLR